MRVVRLKSAIGRAKASSKTPRDRRIMATGDKSQRISKGRMKMGSWLSEREQRLVAGAETASAATPIPTQIVSNGEYLPPNQSETQKRVERRILELADEND